MSDAPGFVALPPIRAQARAAVARAWERAIASGALPVFPADATRPPVEIERPADSAHGDFASNLAMKLARPYRMAPLAIAQALAAELTHEAAADPPRRRSRAPTSRRRVPQPPPADGALEATVAAILADPPGWGRVAPTHPRSVNVEFVSANPTGPLHIGNARGAFIGDLLCRVLEAGGQQVTREYYFNDSGAQIGNLGASVAALKRGEPVPEDGYQGAYVARARGRRPRRRLDGRHRRRRRHRGRHRPVGGRSRARRDRGQPRGARRALRRLDERGAAP